MSSTASSNNNNSNTITAHAPSRSHHPPPPQSSLPLSHLALRPSTLALLTAAGFVTAYEVYESIVRGGYANFHAELGGDSLTTAHAVGREVLLLAAATTTKAAGRDGDDEEKNRVTTNHSNTNGIHRMSVGQLLLQQQQQLQHRNSTLPTTTNCRSIITFCRDLDTVLQGGIAVQEVTELAGPPGTGKTALCTQLAVNAALPIFLGGVHGQCVYIDTEGSFSAERCGTMATALLQHVQAGWRRRKKQRQQQQQPVNTSSHRHHPLQPDNDDDEPDNDGWNATTQEILEGIHVFRVHDAAHLEAVLHGALPALLSSRHNSQQPSQQPIKLVVVDSLAFPYRAYDVRQADFVTRTRQLTQHCHHLTQLAQQHQLAVVVVNQMTTKQGEGLVPALGESWAHAVTTRLLLSSSSSTSHAAHQQQQQQQRTTCRLTKSPRLPNAAADFQIVEAGVRGMEYKTSSSSSKNPTSITNRQDGNPNKRDHSTHSLAHHHQHPHP